MAGIERNVAFRLKRAVKRKKEELGLDVPEWQYFPRSIIETRGEKKLVGPYYYRLFGSIFTGVVIEGHPDGHIEEVGNYVSNKNRQRARSETLRALPVLVSRLKNPNN
jgi:hypothetical protein